MTGAGGLAGVTGVCVAPAVGSWAKIGSDRNKTNRQVAENMRMRHLP